MNKSATMLGAKYGLSAQEMNLALEKLGYLKGEPGEYCPTEKAMPYIHEKEYHRGTGGYSQYNRYWTTRSYDESIEDELDITESLIKEVKEELAARRRAQLEARKEMFKPVETEFSEKITDAAEELSKIDTDSNCLKTLKIVGVVGLSALGVAGVGYIIYRCVKSAKAKKQPEQK